MIMYKTRWLVELPGYASPQISYMLVNSMMSESRYLIINGRDLYCLCVSTNQYSSVSFRFFSSLPYAGVLVFLFFVHLLRFLKTIILLNHNAHHKRSLRRFPSAACFSQPCRLAKPCRWPHEDCRCTSSTLPSLSSQKLYDMPAKLLQTELQMQEWRHRQTLQH